VTEIACADTSGSSELHGDAGGLQERQVDGAAFLPHLGNLPHGLVAIRGLDGDVEAQVAQVGLRSLEAEKPPGIGLALHGRRNVRHADAELWGERVANEDDGAAGERTQQQCRRAGRFVGPAKRRRQVGPPKLEARSLDTSTEVAHRVGNADLAVASVGDAAITREVMHPGWRWSTDVKPVVGTDLCRASHQFFIASGRLHVVVEDGVEIELAAGDAGIIPPGHDAWVVGDEPAR